MGKLKVRRERKLVGQGKLNDAADWFPIKADSLTTEFGI